jgi:hypothetical protein
VGVAGTVGKIQYTLITTVAVDDPYESGNCHHEAPGR